MSRGMPYQRKKQRDEEESLERVLGDLERIQHIVLRIARNLDSERSSPKSRKRRPGLPLPQLPTGYQPFGARMRRLRLAKGVSVEHVAKAVGTHKGYVSGIETSQVPPPSPRFISALARFFSVDEKELLRLAYAQKAPALIRDEIIATLWP
jgi:hypothetical protein